MGGASQAAGALPLRTMTIDATALSTDTWNILWLLAAKVGQ
jgi:hypothetical protein